MSSRLMRFASCITAAAFVAAGLAGYPARAQDPESTVISEAEEHFRLGVRLYEDGNFREALDEFNRAIALNPTYEAAIEFRERTEVQLDIASVGDDPTEQPTFQTFDVITPDQASDPNRLTPEENKIQRVRELNELGEDYLEYQMYPEAVEAFTQVRLIAPDNNRAAEGLHKATLGLYEERTEDFTESVREQTEFIRSETQQMKLLPEGADGAGIRDYRLSVPNIDERIETFEQRSRLDETLDNPVGLVFEDIHLRDLLDFITDTYDLNIMVDNRVVAPPPGEQDTAVGAIGAAPPPRPAPGGGGGGGGFGNIGAGISAGPGPGGGNQQNQNELFVTDGMIPFINLQDISLRSALKALLRPLNLDYSIQADYLWISTPERIRTETFEDLETKFYTLQNAGAETLFKIVVTNTGGFGSTTGLSESGGNQGGQGGGAGGLGGGAGGAGGGAGGFGGGAGGGAGGGGFGGGGGAGGGGFGGGGGGGQGGQEQGESSFTNISELFDTIDDTEVGEFPTVFGNGTGAGGFGGGAGGGGGFGAAGGAGGTGAFGGQGLDIVGPPGPGLGTLASFGFEPTGIQILRSVVPPVIEPVSRRLLSFMRYNLLLNQLVVHTTPSNHELISTLLQDLDQTPKQVAIEAKFLTVSVDDLDKEGFRWNWDISDTGTRSRPIPGVNDQTGEFSTYEFDIDGDGVFEQIPFFLNPDGTPTSDQTFTNSILEALVSPGPDASFSLGATLFNTASGDSLGVTYEFLDSLQESELLSAPRVTTMNQKPAVVTDITSQFFLTNVITDVQVLANSTSNISDSSVLNTFQNLIFQQFIFGITLSVTPQISGDQIRLWLNPQVVTLVGLDTFEITNSFGGEPVTSTISLPRTNTQAVWTNVVVSDGDTVVLGGLVRDTTNKIEEKTPYLADIPIIGYFFRGKSREVRQSSLLIFVTTDILDTTGARYFEPDI